MMVPFSNRFLYVRTINFSDNVKYELNQWGTVHYLLIQEIPQQPVAAKLGWKWCACPVQAVAKVDATFLESSFEICDIVHILSPFLEFHSEKWFKA